MASGAQDVAAAVTARIDDGEEARVLPGPPVAAEVHSRGRLPLRTRTTARHHSRPAFPGTAVVVGDLTFEVLSETEFPEEGRVVYALRPWPDGEVMRDRLVYGPALVRSAQDERQRERVRARVRPWRHLLYPVVGTLPEEQQERVCERLGLYSVTATLVSGLCESLGVLALVALAARGADPGTQVALVVTAPAVMLLMLPGLSRAAGALLFRETAGSPVLGPLVGTLAAFREARARHDALALPLTRRTFRERLSRPDRVERRGDALVFRGPLPHVSWTHNRTLAAGADYWRVEPEPPDLEQGRVVYTYVVAPLRAAAAGEGPGEAPPTTAYADEVRAGIERDWDEWNAAFGWLTTFFAADVQARAFGHRGGPNEAARPTRFTAVLEGVMAAYGLSFLPGGPAADPVAPFVLALGVVLAADAVLRLRAASRGRYGPSLLRFALPVHLLRPERRAYEEHREAERQALAELGRRAP